MRSLKLINGNGEILDITTKQLFAYDLKGFGYQRDEQYRRIGNRFIRIDKQPTQLPIELKICFNDKNPYAQYQDFIRFCNIEPLTLEYYPDTEWYRRSVTLSRVDKTERTKYGTLEIGTSFTPLTPWYKEDSKFVPIHPESDKAFVWPVRWDTRWGNAKPMTAVINSDSVVPSPCTLTIYGPIKNPSWRHYCEGYLVSTGLVRCEVPDGNVLVVDNTTDPYSIAIYDLNHNLILDEYQNSDFATERFVNIQNGINTVSVSGDNNPLVSIKVEAKLYYESV